MIEAVRRGAELELEMKREVDLCRKVLESRDLLSTLFGPISIFCSDPRTHLMRTFLATLPILQPNNMSSNNIYKDEIDFAALALTDADFAKV